MRTSILLLVALATFSSFGAKKKEPKIELPLPAGTRIIDVGPKTTVKTLEAALERVRKIREENKKDPIALRVAPGEYAPSQALVFSSKFASPSLPPLFIYAADFAKKPRIHGGEFVTGWKKTTFNGRKDVWVADASKLHPTDDRRQLRLTYNGRRQTAARYPNVDPAMPYTSGFAYAAKRSVYYTDEIKMRPEECRKWAHPEDGVITYCPRHSYNWGSSVIVDVTNDVILIKGKHKEAKGSFKWDRWCVQNLAEELDEPGEWYYDPRAQKIYFLPPNKADPNKAIITLERADSVFRFKSGSGNCTLAGLEIAGGKDGVAFMGSADDVSIIACSIHDVGGTGLYGGTGIWISGRRAQVRDCDIFNTGCNGIVVHSHSDDGRFDSRIGIVIENNYIHHCGELNPDGAGIFNCGQGVTISHNLMHDMPRMAISGYGRFCDISYNRIRHTNTMSSDTGALYDSYWTQGAGTKIRYNWISDSIGLCKKGMGVYMHKENACGIYFDECSGGTEVYGNLIVGCHWTAVMMHNARWVTVSNNVFVSNGWVPVWHYTHQLEISSWGKSGFTGKRREMYSGATNQLRKGDPRWKTLPSLAQDPMTDEVFSESGAMTMGVQIVNNIISYPDQYKGVLLYGANVDASTNRFDNNLYWAGKGKKLRSCTRVWQNEDTSWDAWLNEKRFDLHSVIADPLFRDAAKRDFRLKPQSPAFKLGFKELPYDEMGLKVTSFRPVLPKEAEGLREHPEWLTDSKNYAGNKARGNKNGSRAASPNVRAVSPNMRK